MRYSLSHVLWLFGGIIVMMLLITCILVNMLLTNSMRAQRREMIEIAAEDVARKIQEQVDEIGNRAHSMAEHADVKKFTISTPSRMYQAKEAIFSKLGDITAFMSVVEDARLRLTDGRDMHYVSERADFQFVERAFDQVLSVCAVEEPFWGTLISDICIVDGKGMFAVASPIYVGSGMKYTGAMINLCSLDTLLQRLPQDDGIYIVSRNGKIAASTSEEFANRFARVEHGETEFSLGGTKMYSTRCEIGTLGWTLDAAYPAVVAEEGGTMHVWLAALMGVVLALTVGILLWVHHIIVTPIKDITIQMRAMQGMNARIETPASGENEMLRLTQGINAMIHALENTTRDMLSTQERLYQVGMLRMRERILFLQAQINPHFLYNNLECIRGMALMNDGEGIREMVVCMASLYRYCVVEEKEACLRDEIDSLSSYMRIIALRYNDTYLLECDVPEALMNRRVVRMMLEPLVENTIRHGFLSAHRECGRIRVIAREQGTRLRVVIRDDGGAMPGEKMDRINRELRQMRVGDAEGTGGRIGVYNVNARVRLIFGEDCGVQFARNDWGGLDAIVEISSKKPETRR